jgi:hypothetical protein
MYYLKKRGDPFFWVLSRLARDLHWQIQNESEVDAKMKNKSNESMNRFQHIISIIVN